MKTDVKSDPIRISFFELILSRVEQLGDNVPKLDVLLQRAASFRRARLVR